MIKPFSGHKNGPWGLNIKTSKNISEVATLRNLNFRIASSISLKPSGSQNFSFQGGGFAQILSYNGTGDGTARYRWLKKLRQ
jgi:hypothetical protein